MAANFGWELARASGSRAWLWVLLAAPLTGQATSRMSLAMGGTQGDDRSTTLAVSAEGSVVAFTSEASNLVSGDTNGSKDVFVRDRTTGATTRASVASDGTEGNDNSGYPGSPSISADGRWVAFFSRATNLVVGDTNAEGDVFVHDRQTGATERVSIATDGAQANSWSFGVSISADGRYVAFYSPASNLVAGDTNGWQDVFVRDRQLGTTERVSVATNGGQGNSDSHFPFVSADGRWVAFDSSCSNLVAGDTNASWDVFVRDRQLGTTERISIATDGTQGNDMSDDPSISADGRYVAFRSHASNLVPGDTNACWDLFVRDRLMGSIEATSPVQVGGNSMPEFLGTRISADGRYVAMMSVGNLFANSGSGWRDIYLHDRSAGTIERVNVPAIFGIDGDSDSPAVSAAGRFVAFSSKATVLVIGDTNAQEDVFLRDRDTTGFTVHCEPGTAGVIGCPCSNPPVSAGRGCENSSGTGGAVLAAAGDAYVAADNLVFTTSAEKPTSTSIVLQGNAFLPSGVVFGQGVRCAGGALKRLFTKTAAGGSITAPNFGAGDPSVSTRSTALGDPIQAGQSRWYLVYYRDPIVLGGCPTISTFNATPTGRIDWSL